MKKVLVSTAAWLVVYAGALLAVAVMLVSVKLAWKWLEWCWGLV